MKGRGRKDIWFYVVFSMRMAFGDSAVSASRAAGPDTAEEITNHFPSKVMKVAHLNNNIEVGLLSAAFKHALSPPSLAEDASLIGSPQGL
ncbi:hypothetical protein MGYG_07391 [Nannizzia gypsea CBS 118893]|uniref:Uncharacterized protein n=1 Tax=Arthroderma gypseum (strain ATCC MYA-4604 / CBS 118893) TaxID=535722 RepID=E4V310_ARTGP|nr:hypothetical protein MGYG_07391 [Nannizzia gypsea CBS 118893]EFR04384.1 hypothetical protein MGYG_07391 [Nannizzia gypsea CBS 118893]